MEFSDLLVILGSFQNIFNFCVSQKLLASCQQCSRCGCNMELTETTQVKDGYMWRLKFGAKRKYKRGRVSEGPWVFGVVERGSQKVLLFRVPDRTRETLVHHLITTHIQPGTVIYSHQFTPYIPLNQLGYIHVSVNHSKNFVDPDSGAHTNTIEGVWALVKKKLKWMSGTLYEYIPSYLDEFTWFRNFGKDQAFEQLLKDITEQFPLQ